LIYADDFETLLVSRGSTEMGVQNRGKRGSLKCKTQKRSVLVSTHNTFNRLEGDLKSGEDVLSARCQGEEKKRREWKGIK